MTEIARLILDLLHTLWPMRLVRRWEAGLYFLGAKVWVVGPGWKLFVPYFGDVVCVSMVPEIHTTPLQTITLRDGSTLTYSASLTVAVRDAKAAYCNVGHFRETIVELAARMLSDGLADAEVERFAPTRGKRDRLIEEQRKELNAVCAEYGVEVTALGLNNFARGVRTMRLLLDRAVLTGAHNAGDLLRS